MKTCNQCGLQKMPAHNQVVTSVREHGWHMGDGEYKQPILGPDGETKCWLVHSVVGGQVSFLLEVADEQLLHVGDGMGLETRLRIGGE